MQERTKPTQMQTAQEMRQQQLEAVAAGKDWA